VFQEGHFPRLKVTGYWTGESEQRLEFRRIFSTSTQWSIGHSLGSSLCFFAFEHFGLCQEGRFALVAKKCPVKSLTKNLPRLELLWDGNGHFWQVAQLKPIIAKMDEQRQFQSQLGGLQLTRFNQLQLR